MLGKLQKNRKLLIRVAIAVISVLILAFLALFFLDRSIVFSCEDGETETVGYMSQDGPSEVTAVMKGHIFNREGVPLEVTVEGDVDYTKLGDYKLKYTVSYKGKTKSITRIITVADIKAPDIILNGASEVSFEVGGEYTEAGCVATDDYDGDVTSKVSIEGTVDINVPGEYRVTYRVSDAAGNEATLDRIVWVTDSIPPEIKLEGGSASYVKKGDEFADPGYSASDNIDGDLTDKVTVSGTVDTSTVGVYTVTYEVADTFGNVATANRIVRVFDTQVATVDPGNKVVYLTFDDGPGPYTQQLLDVLDKYNVKVTFFVTNSKPAYQSLIGEEARRGHTVAIHTYSHKYDQIYASTDAYFADLNAMNNIIIEQTGESAAIIRFPGGSSNTISKSYSPGIMSTLVNEVEAKGFKYADWNVASGDAGEVTTREAVVQNVINGIQSNNVSVVLQHDIKGFSVEAVEEIIQWGLSEGYTFLPMTPESPMKHHSVNN